MERNAEIKKKHPNMYIYWSNPVVSFILCSVGPSVYISHSLHARNLMFWQMNQHHIDLSSSSTPLLKLQILFHFKLRRRV